MRLYKGNSPRVVVKTNIGQPGKGGGKTNPSVGPSHLSVRKGGNGKRDARDKKRFIRCFGAPEKKRFGFVESTNRIAVRPQREARAWLLNQADDAEGV